MASLIPNGQGSPFVGGVAKPTFTNVPQAAKSAPSPTSSSSAPSAPAPSSPGQPASTEAQSFLDQINSAGATGASGGGSSDNPVLYWGSEDNMSGQRARRLARGEKDTQGDRYTTLADAQQEFYRWSVADRKAWGDYLVNLGLLTADEATDYGTLQKQWAASIDEAVNFHAAGKQVNPWQAAAMMAGADNPGATAKSKAKGFTGTKKTHDARVDLTDPASAKALVNDVLSKQLGRAATDEEIRQFTSVLHTAEANNPIVQDTTSTYVNGDNTSSSTTNTGGLDSAGKAQLLTDQALQKPEYGAYQAAATYFPVLAQAIASPVH